MKWNLMKRTYSYLGIAALVASTYAIIGAQAQWMENGQECHMDVNEVTVCAPSPSPTPPSGGGYYGGGGQAGSGPGNGGNSGPGNGSSGGGGSNSDGGGGSGLPWNDIQWPDFAPDWDNFLPTLRAIVFCENMVGHWSGGRWRVYFAFDSESAFTAEEVCRAYNGTSYVVWNSRRPPGGTL